MCSHFTQMYLNPDFNAKLHFASFDTTAVGTIHVPIPSGDHWLESNINILSLCFSYYKEQAAWIGSAAYYKSLPDRILLSH